MKELVIAALLAGVGYYLWSTRTPTVRPAIEASTHPSDTTPGANAAARMDNLSGQAPPP